MRKASIKETGEELSPAEWARFDAAVARLKTERDHSSRHQDERGLFDAHDTPMPRRDILMERR